MAAPATATEVAAYLKGIETDDERLVEILTGVDSWLTARVEPTTPAAEKKLAYIKFCAYLYEQPDSVGGIDYADGFVNSGAQRIVFEWLIPRAQLQHTAAAKAWVEGVTETLPDAIKVSAIYLLASYLQQGDSFEDALEDTQLYELLRPWMTGGAGTIGNLRKTAVTAWVDEVTDDLPSDVRAGVIEMLSAKAADTDSDLGDLAETAGVTRIIAPWMKIGAGTRGEKTLAAVKVYIEQQLTSKPPDALMTEAVARMTEWLADAPASGGWNEAYRRSGAQHLLARFRSRRILPLGTEAAPQQAPAVPSTGIGPSTGTGGPGVDQVARDAAAAASRLARSAADAAATADSTANANKSFLSTFVARVRAVVESVVPAWARLPNPPESGGSGGGGLTEEITASYVGTLIGQSNRIRVMADLGAISDFPDDNILLVETDSTDTTSGSRLLPDHENDLTLVHGEGLDSLANLAADLSGQVGAGKTQYVFNAHAAVYIGKVPSSEGLLQAYIVRDRTNYYLGIRGANFSNTPTITPGTVTIYSFGAGDGSSSSGGAGVDATARAAALAAQNKADANAVEIHRNSAAVVLARQEAATADRKAVAAQDAIPEKATNTDVDGETDDDTFMTPLKTFRAIARKASSSGPATPGRSDAALETFIEGIVSPWSVKGNADGIPGTKTFDGLFKSEAQEGIPGANVTVTFKVGENDGNETDETDAAATNFAISEEQAAETGAFLRCRYSLERINLAGFAPRDIELQLQKSDGTIVGRHNIKDEGGGAAQFPIDGVGQYRWAVRIVTVGSYTGDLRITETTYHSAQPLADKPMEHVAEAAVSVEAEKRQAEDKRLTDEIARVEGIKAIVNGLPAATSVRKGNILWQTDKPYLQTEADAFQVPATGFVQFILGNLGSTGIMRVEDCHNREEIVYAQGNHKISIVFSPTRKAQIDARQTRNNTRSNLAQDIIPNLPSPGFVMNTWAPARAGGSSDAGLTQGQVDARVTRVTDPLDTRLKAVEGATNRQNGEITDNANGITALGGRVTALEGATPDTTDTVTVNTWLDGINPNAYGNALPAKYFKTAGSVYKNTVGGEERYFFLFKDLILTQAALGGLPTYGRANARYGPGTGTKWHEHFVEWRRSGPETEGAIWETGPVNLDIAGHRTGTPAWYLVDFIPEAGRFLEIVLGGTGRVNGLVEQHSSYDGRVIKVDVNDLLKASPKAGETGSLLGETQNGAVGHGFRVSYSHGQTGDGFASGDHPFYAPVLLGIDTNSARRGKLLVACTEVAKNRFYGLKVRHVDA